jgi:hypothetical protein
MAGIPKGARVRQIVKPIEGEVAQKRLHEGDDAIEYRVVHEGGERWFKGTELEVVSLPEAPAEGDAQ